MWQTDRRTDGQTDRQTELRWLRRAIAVPAFVRKKLSPNVGMGLLQHFFVVAERLRRQMLEDFEQRLTSIAKIPVDWNNEILFIHWAAAYLWFAAGVARRRRPLATNSNSWWRRTSWQVRDTSSWRRYDIRSGSFVRVMNSCGCDTAQCAAGAMWDVIWDDALLLRSLTSWHAASAAAVAVTNRPAATSQQSCTWQEMLPLWLKVS